MPTVDVVVESAVPEGFRVEQLKSMFDLPVKDKLRHAWQFELPIEEKPWRIGAIVGPSGAGKTQVARHVFGEAVHRGYDWPADRAVIECFEERHTTPEIVQMLNSVGFSSPPSWLKPWPVLSQGEQFRVGIARALLEAQEGLVVIDEFTSVVDRTVAKIGSRAVAKAVRRGTGRLVAVSCHYDILDWLGPDWVLDMKDLTFRRRRLRRPKIHLELRSVPREVWGVFAPHHYLSGTLHPSSRTWGTFWGETLVAFIATIPNMGFRGVRRVHRLVVLPDYQGVGIGRATLGMAGEEEASRGYRLVIGSSHPGMVHELRGDPAWWCRAWKIGGTSRKRTREGSWCGRPGSIQASFEFIGNGTSKSMSRPRTGKGRSR